MKVFFTKNLFTVIFWISNNCILLCLFVEQVEQWILGAADLQEQITLTRDRVHKLVNAETTEQNLQQHRDAIEVSSLVE